MNINGQQIDKGFNVNDKTQPFTEQILNLLKDIETRDSNSLKSLIGQRVGMIRTGCGKAHVVGLVDIVGVVVYEDADAFRKDYSKHLVAAGSKYDIKSGGKKYGYILANVERCDPVPVTVRGNTIRNLWKEA